MRVSVLKLRSLPFPQKSFRQEAVLHYCYSVSLETPSTPPRLHQGWDFEDVQRILARCCRPDCSPALVTCTLGAWLPRSSNHVMNSCHASCIRASHTHLCPLTARLYCFPTSTPFTEPSATIRDSIKISLKPASPNPFPMIDNILQIVWMFPSIECSRSVALSKHS